MSIRKIKIYVAFISKYYQKQTNINSSYKLMDFLIQTFHPPFGHCSLAFEIKGVVSRHISSAVRNNSLSSDNVLLCTSVSQKSGFVHGLFRFENQGYCWSQLEADETLVEECLKMIEYMVARGLCNFSAVDMYGVYCLSDLERPTRERNNWFCSQLTGFLLQKMGLLDQQINCSRLSASDLFLLIRENQSYKSIPCPLKTTTRKLHLENKITDADNIFKLTMNMENIPLLNKDLYI